MKQKTATLSVTKNELVEVLEDYPSKKELTVILDDRFSKFHKAFSAEMDHRFLVFEVKMERAFSRFTNRIITLIDPLLTEIETRHQDRELVAADIQDLKKRVTKLENA